MFFELGIEQRKRTEEIQYNMLIQLSQKQNKEVNIDKSFLPLKPVRNLTQYLITRQNL